MRYRNLCDCAQQKKARGLKGVLPLYFGQGNFLLVCSIKPILIGLTGYFPKLSGHSVWSADARRMQPASGQRDKRDQPTGTHGGLPKGDVAITANSPASRLIVWRHLFSVSPDAHLNSEQWA